MPDTNLSAALANAIAEALGAEAPPRELKLRGGFGMRPPRAPTYDEIAEDLAQQAVASDNPLVNRAVAWRRLGGGNTAEVVAILSLQAPFILKLDSTDAKLAREGSFMRDVRADMALPERFRHAWPIVYAIREEAPYAYLMEYFPNEQGWRSLEDRLYPKPDTPAVSVVQAQRLLDAALDILFSGYSAKQEKRLRPSIDADYVDRIRERLAAAAIRDPRFASRPIVINGEVLEPWESYLRQLVAGRAYLDLINPPFSTVAHGDPNPGNIMLTAEASAIQVKLIDPKDWRQGDYLFDIAKITHFLLGTGPIEKPADGIPVAVSYSESNASATLAYVIERPVWTDGLVEACLDRVEQFALTHGDPHWSARYELGMAANLLGLPEGRLKNGRPDAALALYGEGLLWLKRFCSRLRDKPSAPAPALDSASVDTIEPTPLAQARALVRRQAGAVREAEDRRGFQVLHWDPATPNSKGKPVELSLEHEARLLPSSASGLRALEAALERAGGTGIAVGEALLPNPEAFAALHLSRFARDPGPQSVDHYWEAVDAPADKRLINRMLSLRERIATRDFMTWAASEGERSLNLELPIFALGNSGVVARLEFNWLDEIEPMLEELRTSVDGVPSINPLILADQHLSLPRGPYMAAIEHTTFREKFEISEAAADGNLSPLFHLNVDHIVAQSLRTRRIVTYTDVDIAPSRRVDADMLARLIEFTEALSARYELIPAGASKVWRDSSLLGELG